jgi:hypothetical protein
MCRSKLTPGEPRWTRELSEWFKAVTGKSHGEDRIPEVGEYRTTSEPSA